MKTKNIYQRYNLMPQLVTHQLRVAGVAKLIGEGMADKEEIDKGVRACLIHDMGNMAKFTGLTDPYWATEQEKFWQKYGHEAHSATYQILRELGLTDYAKILEEEGLFYADKELGTDFAATSKPALLVLYGDLRVTMDGVTSLEARVEDLDQRYPGLPRPEKKWGRELENFVQGWTTTEVASISEGDVSPLFDQLLELEWDIK